MNKVVSIFKKVLLLLFVAGCTGNEQADTTPNAADTTRTNRTHQVAKGLQLGMVTSQEFSTIRKDAIDVACGEYYTYDTCQLKDEKYLFLSDAADLAMMKINGVTITLKRVESKSEQLGQESFEEHYEGGGYTVMLKTIQTSSYDTGSYEAGTLQITSSQGTQTFKIKGMAGC